MAKRDYLVEAAKQIRMALDREVSEDYEAAFSYYKNGVDLLLNGVQGTAVNLLYCILSICRVLVKVILSRSASQHSENKSRGMKQEHVDLSVHDSSIEKQN